MLASMCLETINKLFRESERKYLNDQQLLKTWQEIYHYFRSADPSTIRKLVEDYNQNSHDDLIILPLHIRIGIFKLDKSVVRKNHGNKTVQMKKFLQSIKKKDVVTIVEVHCDNYLDCAKMFSNLKVLEIGWKDVFQDPVRSDYELICVSRECPLLEKVKCHNAVTDIGLEYLGNLTKLKDLTMRRQCSITAMGIVSFLKKSKTVLELFECYPMEDLFDANLILASENEVLPSMKYFNCKLSKLATVKIFPYIRSLVVDFDDSIDDFIEVQHTMKNNTTVKHLNIDGWYIGGSDAYNLLRSLNIIFTQITSLTFGFLEDGELISYLDAEVESSSSATTPFFRSVICLNIDRGITTGMLRTCMFPGNNIKHLRVWYTQLFERAEFRPYLRHLTEVVQIHLDFDGSNVDCKLIDSIVKLLPSLRVFKIGYPFIDPEVLKRMRFICSSNNRYGIQFFVNNYSL